MTTIPALKDLINDPEFRAGVSDVKAGRLRDYSGQTENYLQGRRYARRIMFTQRESQQTLEEKTWQK